MILKVRTQDHGEFIDVWNYYDNIKTASIYYEKETKCPCVDMSFNNTTPDYGHIVLAITDLAFLLNDNGKTIERIANKDAHIPIK